MDKEMLDIAVNLRKKYNKISELLDTTQQMADCINRNDMVSFEILMNMRTDILLEIEEINYLRGQLVEALEPKKEERVRYLMQKGVKIPDDNADEELRIYSSFMDCKSANEKLVAIDKVMSKKICGDKSFYQK
ncbi:MAG: hypothetical protein VB018_06710 [Lachnospiraceae bacterium]|nr:hypothetical protein [Lachnospiraceae bacterium]